MTPTEVQLVALDVLEAVLTSMTYDEVVERMRPDLEVLSRADLIRVALVVGTESAVMATPKVERPRLLRRVGQRRLTVMMEGS